MLPKSVQVFFVVITLMCLPVVDATMVGAFCTNAVSAVWNCLPFFALCVMAGDLMWLPGGRRNHVQGARTVHHRRQVEPQAVRRLAGAGQEAPAPEHRVYPHGFHGRGLPRDAIRLISMFLPALRLRRQMGEDDVVTPEVHQLYFLASERMVVGFLAGAKKEHMLRRRLHGKQSSLDYLVLASRVVEEQRPQVAAAGSPYLKAIFEDSGASVEAAWWDVDYVVLPLLPKSLSLFADLWNLGGSCVKGEGSDFPPGLEVASFPYVLRAIPFDDDCRTWAASNIHFFSWPHVSIVTLFWFSGLLFFFGCEHCRILCDVFHQCMAQSILMHPVLVPPRGHQKEFHLALYSRQIFISTLVALLEAVQEVHPFTLYLCVYGCKFPAREFWEHRFLGQISVWWWANTGNHEAFQGKPLKKIKINNVLVYPA